MQQKEILNITKKVNVSFDELLHNIPSLRATESYNHLQQAKQKLIAALTKEVKS